MAQHPTQGPNGCNTDCMNDCMNDCTVDRTEDCTDNRTAPHGAGEALAGEVIATAEALLRSNPAGAEALARQGIQACDALPLGETAGRAQHVLGLARAYQGDPVGGTAHLSLAVDTFARAGCRRLEGVARCDRASIQGHPLGLISEATEGFEQALKIAVEVGSRQDEGRALSLMGGLFGRIGQWAESERALRRAIDLIDENLDARSHMSACNNLGHLLSQAERFGEAVTILARGLERLERLDPEHRSLACTLRSSLALAVAHTGDVARALALLDQNEALLAGLGACDRVDHALTRGRVHLIGRRADEASPLLPQALADAERADLEAAALVCLCFLSLACEQAGDLRTALESERKLREAERRLLDEHGAARLIALETSLQLQARQSRNLALDRSRMLLRSIVDADDDLIFAKDHQGVFVLANRSFLAHWDLAEAAALGAASAVPVLGWRSARAWCT